MKHIDTIKVGGATIVAGGITVSDINPYLSCLSILIAIGFGLRKWYLMEKNKTHAK